MTDVVPQPGRELTDQAFEAERQIKQTVWRMRGEWVTLAAQLHDFMLHERWRHLDPEGTTYTSFWGWMCQPDVGVEPRDGARLVQIYEQWVVKAGVSPKDLARARMSALEDVVPAVQRGLATPEEALSDAEVLSRADLREKYHNRKHIDQVLNADEEPDFFICSACGSRVRSRAD